jgi:hypothetical protein
MYLNFEVTPYRRFCLEISGSLIDTFPAVYENPKSIVVLKNHNWATESLTQYKPVHYTVPSSYGRFNVFSGWHRTCLSVHVQGSKWKHTRRNTNFKLEYLNT